MENSLKRKLIGTVVSDKMNQTVIVRIENIKTHPKYKKRYKVFKRYAAHNANNEYKLGEKVVIEEHPPISKTKRWIIISRV